jgi:hypothetical protein
MPRRARSQLYPQPLPERLQSGVVVKGRVIEIRNRQALEEF